MRISTFCIPLFACLAAATDLIGRVEPGPDAATRTGFQLRHDTLVLLDGGHAGRALIKPDGTFILRQIPPADYVLTVSSKDYIFPEYLVSVLAANEAVAIRPYRTGHIPSQDAPLIPHPIIIKALGKPEYVEVKQPFNIVNLVKGNPLILLMVVGAGMAFGLPKLMSYLDPEALEEMKANQAQMHKSLGSLQSGDLSGFSKMLSGPDKDAPEAKGGSKKQR